jgi:hypothetical protein
MYIYIFREAHQHTTPALASEYGLRCWQCWVVQPQLLQPLVDRDGPSALERILAATSPHHHSHLARDSEGGVAAWDGGEFPFS